MTTTVQLRQYGQTEATEASFSGEFENELAQQFIESVRSGLVWPAAEVEDLHIRVWSDELHTWVEA